MAKTKTTAEPILENEHVKELLAILRENNSPSTKDFLAVLHHVGAMEKQLDAAVKELAAMRQELRTAQEQNHPVKTALQKAVIVDLSIFIDSINWWKFKIDITIDISRFSEPEAIKAATAGTAA
jgi:dsDNA-specific endonuclease/ATPase MutS2